MNVFFIMPGKRGRQSVKKGIWYLGGRKQRGNGLPLGLLASIGAPILGKIAKPILGKIFGRGKRRVVINKLRRKRIRYKKWSKGTKF